MGRRDKDETVWYTAHQSALARLSLYKVAHKGRKIAGGYGHWLEALQIHPHPASLTTGQSGPVAHPRDHVVTDAAGPAQVREVR